MPTDENLSQLQADLADLLGEAPDVELREFANKDEFAAYAQAELVKASGEKDSDERVARLKHLLENVRIAATLKFEDKGAKSLPVYAGKLSVQSQTAWKERSTRDITVQQAAASQAPGPKGFAQKGLAEELHAALTGLLAKEGAEGSTEGEGEGEGSTEGDGASGEGTGAGEGDGDTTTTTTTTDDAGTTGDDAPGDPEGTTKAMKDPWGTGLDMNIRDADDPDEYGNTSLRTF